MAESADSDATTQEEDLSAPQTMDTDISLEARIERKVRRGSIESPEDFPLYSLRDLDGDKPVEGARATSRATLSKLHYGAAFRAVETEMPALMDCDSDAREALDEFEMECINWLKDASVDECNIAKCFACAFETLVAVAQRWRDQAYMNAWVAVGVEAAENLLSTWIRAGKSAPVDEITDDFMSFALDWVHRHKDELSRAAVYKRHVDVGRSVALASLDNAVAYTRRCFQF